jgi:hypothetical protein
VEGEASLYEPFFAAELAAIGGTIRDPSVLGGVGQRRERRE